MRHEFAAGGRGRRGRDRGFRRRSRGRHQGASLLHPGRARRVRSRQAHLLFRTARHCLVQGWLGKILCLSERTVQGLKAPLRAARGAAAGGGRDSAAHRDPRPQRLRSDRSIRGPRQRERSEGALPEDPAFRASRLPAPYLRSSSGTSLLTSSSERPKPPVEHVRSACASTWSAWSSPSPDQYGTRRLEPEGRGRSGLQEFGTRSPRARTPSLKPATRTSETWSHVFAPRPESTVMLERLVDEEGLERVRLTTKRGFESTELATIWKSRGSPAAATGLPALRAVRASYATLGVHLCSAALAPTGRARDLLAGAS